jgi:hypothetical protein
LTSEEVDFPGGHSDAVFAGDDFVHFAVLGIGDRGGEGGEGSDVAESDRERYMTLGPRALVLRRQKW